MKGLVFDAGAFLAVERRDGGMVRIIRRAALDRASLITSAGVVAQIWRGGAGRQAPVALLLRRVEVVDLTHATARVLGCMLGAAREADAVDAHVVLLARERGWPVLTTDADDLLAIDPTLIVERI